jgi:hypothetical protein
MRIEQLTEVMSVCCGKANVEGFVMQPINSILVVVDRSLAARDAMAKAVLLARKFHARIELFMCDAECRRC